MGEHTRKRSDITLTLPPFLEEQGKLAEIIKAAARGTFEEPDSPAVSAPITRAATTSSARHGFHTAHTAPLTSPSTGYSKWGKFWTSAKETAAPETPFDEPAISAQATHALKGLISGLDDMGTQWANWLLPDVRSTPGNHSAYGKQQDPKPCPYVEDVFSPGTRAVLFR